MYAAEVAPLIRLYVLPSIDEYHWFVPVDSDNPHVLAFLRVLEPGNAADEEPQCVLCLNNLSSSPQATRLLLPDRAGATLADVFGGSGFEAVPADGTLPMTLGSRDFFWLTVTGGERTP